MNLHRHPVPLVLATALLVALPASSAPSGPPTQVWIDVATHQMAGMPDLGALGGMANRMMGNPGPKGYPQSRGIPASTGKLLDIAMHNRLRPGIPAEQLVPAGLDVGKSLPLLPPPPGERHEERPGHTQPDAEITLRQYWGCGTTVRPGQPKVMTVKAKGANVQTSGALAPNLFVPDRDIDVDPSLVLWPNPKNSKRVSERSSMVGQHRITGDGVPESLQFELGKNADFMPKVALRTRGQVADSIAVDWQPVDRSRAFFLSAVAMQDERTVVFWSSSEVAGAGQELLNYLTGSTIDKWLKQKVLLPPTATSCAIPQGIFKPSGNSEMGGMGMLSLIAYGPETNLAWPPRPADPKAPWNPEWNVRVRTKSTAMAMLGVDLSGMEGMDGLDPGADPASQEQQKPESTGKKLLKGLLRNL